MSKIEKSFKEIEQLHILCQGYLDRTEKAPTQLTEEIRRFLRKQIAPLVEEFQEEVYLNQVRAAHKDEKGVLLKNQDGSFKFTMDGEMERIKLNRELRNQARELHCRFIGSVPQDLTIDEKEAFEGVFWSIESNQ